MICTNCKKESDTITIMVDVTTNKPDYICDDCLMSSNEHSGDIEKLDKEIDEILGAMETFRNAIPNFDESAYPKELLDFSWTPSKALKSGEKLYKSLMDKKKSVLNSLSERDRLSYELKVAIKKEKFELAAELREKIRELT